MKGMQFLRPDGLEVDSVQLKQRYVYAQGYLPTC